MSSNRLIYDTCAYKHTLSQSVGPLAYVLDPSKYEHCHKCRIELGVVGGTAAEENCGTERMTVVNGCGFEFKKA